MNEYTYDDIVIGQKERFTKAVSEEMMREFCEVSGDQNPLHSDKNYAKSLGYRDRVAYGMLTASLLSTLAGVWLPGKYSLIHHVECSFPFAVFVGDTLTVEGEVVEKNDLFRVLKLKVTVRNQNDEKVLRGKMRVGVSK